METTFYDDVQNFRSREEIKMLKRTMTLDLDSNSKLLNPQKKQKFTALLTSPDMHMLKLASPELERLIIAQNGMVTTTPTPTSFMFSKNVTEEQEQYARGFVDALVHLHQNGTGPNQNGVQVNANGENMLAPEFITMGGGNYTILQPQGQSVSLNQSTTASSTVISTAGLCNNRSDSVDSTRCLTSLANIPPSYSSSMSLAVSSSSYVPNSSSFFSTIPTIKEEPQTVPSMRSTPPLSPIDMENQEKIKLERKRLRNRIAASKCRRRKLERIARLEDKVRLLKGENSELSTVATRLRDQVCQLKQQVMEHVKSGCQIMVTQQYWKPFSFF